MAHRALVAYEREDGQYSLHYSHNGADSLRLTGDITLATPFGGEARHKHWAHNKACPAACPAEEFEEREATLRERFEQADI